MIMRSFLLLTMMLSLSLCVACGEDEEEDPQVGVTGKALYEGGVAPSCTGCHGADGGPGAVSQKDLRTSSDTLTDAQLSDKIRNGVSGTAMPAYDASKLSDDQINLIIGHLKSL